MYVGGGDTVAPGQFLMTKDGILKGQSIQYEHMVSTLSFNLYSSVVPHYSGKFNQPQFCDFVLTVAFYSLHFSEIGRDT